MPVPAVRLKIRVRLCNGNRAYLDPVFSSNGKLKPLYAVVLGKPEHHPEGSRGASRQSRHIHISFSGVGLSVCARAYCIFRYSGTASATHTSFTFPFGSVIRTFSTYCCFAFQV